ncbi:hypothetical protein KI387_022776 [Taxus chinensis]|uniref:SCP2 domain-containing protein n=1 Tax=Taxus chinensis TaxID=29808 RepID=A0AA38L6B4_TAXCH|nr:hypothetical protein KI387_022776 [Taxus chinensis]
MGASEDSVDSGSKLKSAAALELAKKHLATQAGDDLKKKIGLVYQLNISPKKIGIDEEVFVVDLKNAQVTKGPYEGKPDATFSFVDNDFLAVVTGKMNPQIAFMSAQHTIQFELSQGTYAIIYLSMSLDVVCEMFIQFSYVARIPQNPYRILPETSRIRIREGYDTDTARIRAGYSRIRGGYVCTYPPRILEYPARIRAVSAFKNVFFKFFEATE